MCVQYHTTFSLDDGSDSVMHNFLILFVGVSVHQESFSARGTSVFLQTECVMETETAPLELMKLSVQVEVQTIIKHN